MNVSIPDMQEIVNVVRLNARIFLIKLSKATHNLKIYLFVITFVKR